MARELVHVEHGRVTWSVAVHRIASMLDPLGSAAEIIAKQGVVTMSGSIVQFHAVDGDTLVRLSDSLRLGDAESAIVAFQQLER